MAHVLVTRGDLQGAMTLYEQALEIKERVGDLQGKASTLGMMAQLQYRQGQRDPALTNMRECLHLFEHLGATREIATAREVLQQMERAQPGETVFRSIGRWWQRLRGAGKK
jgi:tetratricopeptide (TPR) repeat protein